MQRILNRLAGLFLLLLLAACAPPQRAGTKRYFWPPVAGAERLEYLGTIFSDRDVTAGRESRLYETIFGVERPRMIFQRPHYLTTDRRGRLLVSDIGLNKVLVLDFASKELSFLKDARGREDFVFAYPSGMAVDDHGELWVVDNLRRKISVFNEEGRLTREVRVTASGRLSGLAWSSLQRCFYLAATEEHRLLMLDERGEQVATVGRRGTGPAEFNFPTDVAVDAQGQVYVLDSLNARVQVLTPDGTFVREFGERGTALGSFQIPKGIAVSPQGYTLVTDGLAHKVVIFGPEGEFLLTFGGKFSIARGRYSPGGFYMPQGIHVDGTGTVWVADTLNRSVQRFQILTGDYLREHPILPGQAASATMPSQP